MTAAKSTTTTTNGKLKAAVAKPPVVAKQKKPLAPKKGGVKRATHEPVAPPSVAPAIPAPVEEEASGPNTGRVGRSAVEDPIEATPAERGNAAKATLNLLLRVKTSYKAMSGGRHQISETCGLRDAIKPENANVLRQKWRQMIATAADPSVRSTSSSSGSSGVVQRHLWTMLPEFLSEELWERHQYSISDVRKTLDAFPARILWQLVLSYNRPVTNASSRICSDSDRHLTFGAKPSAIQKLVTIFRELHPEWGKRPSVTWDMSSTADPNGDGRNYDVADRHVPCLPVHKIQRSVFDVLANNVAQSSGMGIGLGQVSAWAAQVSITTKLARNIYAWRGILFVPLELNQNRDTLLVARVLPWNAYVNAYGPAESFSAIPNSVLSTDGFYALLDEAFYFYCPPAAGGKGPGGEAGCHPDGRRGILKRPRQQPPPTHKPKLFAPS
jgi:hypothetical protein